jgi:hypothetical protein
VASKGAGLTMDVTQPSEPLGDCYNLGELERAIRRAINRYGADTSIYGDGEIKGFTLHAYFPKGQKPHVTFMKIGMAYSDKPPENLI